MPMRWTADMTHAGAKTRRPICRFRTRSGFSRTSLSISVIRLSSESEPAFIFHIGPLGCTRHGRFSVSSSSVA